MNRLLRQPGALRARLKRLYALAVLLAPAAALACPTCATRDGPGLGVLLAVGAMIAVPFVVAAVTIRAVRKLERGR